MRNNTLYALITLILCLSSTQIVQATPVSKAPSIWCGQPGDSLKKIIQQWAQKSHWRVQWQFDYDYPIVVTTCFKGSFTQAMQQVAQAYRNAEYPFYLDLYPRQQLVVVSH